MAKKANINLIVLFLHDFGWPKPKAFHFGPNQLMIRYLEKEVGFISGMKYIAISHKYSAVTLCKYLKVWLLFVSSAIFTFIFLHFLVR